MDMAQFGYGNMKCEGMLIKNPFPKASVRDDVLGTVQCH